MTVSVLNVRPVPWGEITKARAEIALLHAQASALTDQARQIHAKISGLVPSDVTPCPDWCTNKAASSHNWVIAYTHENLVRHHLGERNARGLRWEVIENLTPTGEVHNSRRALVRWD